MTGTEHRACNHQFFVCANDANGGLAGVRGNHARRLRIARRMQLNAEEAQPFTDARADQRCMFADTSCEDERVHSTECSGEGANPFLDLIAKQRDGLSRSHVIGFLREQVPHVGRGLRHAEQPGLVVDHVMKLQRRHVVGAREIADQSWVQISRAGAHRQPCRRRETHAGVNAATVAHGGQTGAVAEMREDHAAGRGCGVAHAREFFHQIRIGQTVKPISLNACCVETSWNRQ